MAGRGRGRGAGGGLKGATWEHDPEMDKLGGKPTDLFPTHPNLKRPAPLTEQEMRQIKHYKNLQTQIHRGPLYTQPTKRDPDAQAKTFSEEQFNSQYGSNKKADMNPFLGVETYSMRYAPKKNDLPKLSDRPFNKALFPKELWSTLEGDEGKEVRNHINRAIQKKALILGDMKNTKSGTDDKTNRLLEKFNSAAGDEEGEDGENDEEKEEVEVDSEFEDDDGGDYDAEKYFDAGEGDSDGDGDGGEEY